MINPPPRAQRNRQPTTFYGSESDGSEILTTIKNTTIQTIVSRLTEDHPELEGAKIKKGNANTIIDQITNALNVNISISSNEDEYTINSRRLPTIIANLFDQVLQYERTAQMVETRNRNTNDELKLENRAYLDCMFNLLSGALNISSRNMTNGNFLSGETLLNNGVIDEKIIQELANIQNTNKSKGGGFDYTNPTCT